MPPPVYCIDTSSIIVWYVEVYPPEIFPGLLDRMEELVATGRLLAPKAVFDEIRRGEPHQIWARSHTDIFVEESTSVQRIVRDLMATYGNRDKPHKAINGADPFVVAMARNGGANWTVVTDEHPGSPENRKIPYVCSLESVDCINFRGLMLREGWRF